MLFKPFSRDLFANNHSVNYGCFQTVLGNCKKQDKMIHKCFSYMVSSEKNTLKYWNLKNEHKQRQAFDCGLFGNLDLFLYAICLGFVFHTAK